MHIGIITYQTGHLKTWQIVKKLLTKSFEITLFAFPFVPRVQKKRFFEDRPYQLLDLNIKEFCSHHNIDYIEIESWEDKNAHMLGKINGKNPPEAYLTCIAKIIPKSFIQNRIIINAHPGLLPENRGLDAFKWSVVNGWPIGISIHVINEEIDMGIVLHRVNVPVLPEDILSNVVTRAYEMECDLQANFDYYLDKLTSGVKVTNKYPLSKKRVPKEIDDRLEEIFLSQKSKLIELSKTV